MNKLSIFLVKCSILLAIVFLSSCGKDEPFTEPEVNNTGLLELRFVPTMNGQPFQLNTPFIGPNNKRIQIETFKSYVSQIQLSENGVVKGKNDIALIDFGSATKSILINTTAGNIDKIEFGIGVNKALNGTGDPNFSPSSYATSHPLSIYNGMYWTWASGYIFFKIEGRIDTSASQTQTPLFTCFYHTGLDTLYTTKTFSDLNLNVSKGQTTVVEIAIEFNDIFKTQTDTIDMVEKYFTHTSDDIILARKIVTNFKLALRRL